MNNMQAPSPFKVDGLERFNNNIIGLPDNDVGLQDIANFLRARRWIILRTFMACVAIALLYWAVATPRYTSTAYILLDQKSTKFSEVVASSTDPTSDAANLESQISILTSDRLAKKVIIITKLLDDKLFFPPPNILDSAIQSGLSYIRKPEAESPDARMQEAIESFQRAVKVHRVNLSYVLSIEFSHPSPNRAAYIVNELVKEYIRELDSEKAEASRKAAGWLDDQLNILQQNLRTAQIDLENFKTSKILLPGSGAGSDVDAKSVNQKAVESKTKVAELEAAADRNKTIYDTFLQKYSETLQSVYPGNKAVIISEGQVPFKKSWPKLTILLALASPAGLVLGLMIAYVRNTLDNKINTASELEAASQCNCLGIAPILEGDVGTTVITSPFSRFAETIRSVKLAVDLKRIDSTVKVIGITSSVASEGKSTISLNLAAVMAQAGASVILVDADLRVQGLTRAAAAAAERGLLEVLQGTHSYTDCIERTEAGFDILPAVVLTPIPSSNELISGVRMRSLLEELSGAYDYVVLDLPPLLAVVDTRSMVSIVDAFLFVATWRIRKETVKQAINQNQVISGRFLGSILNKVNLRKYEGADTVVENYYYYYGETTDGKKPKRRRLKSLFKK